VTRIPQVPFDAALGQAALAGEVGAIIAEENLHGSWHDLLHRHAYAADLNQMIE
jgi:hypothetical protein